jgi:hypothetical protein
MTVAVSFVLAIPALAVPLNAEASGKSAKARTARGELVHRIVAKWGNHVQETYRRDVRRWAMDMVPTLSRVSIATLERAADASTFQGMNDALLSSAPAGETLATAGTTNEKPRFTARVLGDADKDLIFVPVTPCRIIDTRVAGGVIAANTTRGFDVTAVANYSFQGGDASNCGGVGAAGSFAAAAINFTVVTPSAAGYITAFPFGGTQPLAATVNYTAGDIRGNFAVVKLDQGASANEMNVYSFAQTHLVADIVGYFINPGPLVFECQDTLETVVTIGTGAGDNAFAPACASGYIQTATNCKSTSYLMPIVYQAGGACSARNNSGGNADLSASRTCCRARRT